MLLNQNAGQIDLNEQDPRLREIWQQKAIPVIYRQNRPNPVLLRIPYSSNNLDWIRGNNRNYPRWNPQYKCWEIPTSWFDEMVERVLRHYGKLYVIQLHRENQKCAHACWNAKGFHCECSCMGANHGSGHPGGVWHEISDTFAFQWGDKKYACRLLNLTTN